MWDMVDVKFRKEFRQPVTLAAIKAQASLKKIPLVQRGSRLSIMPVTGREWKTILKLAEVNSR